MINDVENQISNPNLLINWDFRNPVNQRGKQKYEGQGYAVDRWYIYSTEDTPSLTVADNHITLKRQGTKSFGMYQTPERPTRYSGMACTFSVKYRGSAFRIRVHSVELNKRIASKDFPASETWAIVSVTFTVPELTDDKARLELLIESGTNAEENYALDVQSAKLEVGSRSTLQLDEKANYAEQLALCQRYYQKIAGTGAPHIGMAVATSNNSLRLNVPIPVTLRTTPKISCQGLGLYYPTQMITDITGVTMTSNTVTIDVSEMEHGMTMGERRTVFLESNGFLVLNAEP